MRALRRVDNKYGACLWTSYEALLTTSEADLTSYERSLLASARGVLSLLGLDSGKRSRRRLF